MRRKSLLVTAGAIGVTGALAFHGCSAGDGRQQVQSENDVTGAVGSVGLELTLPDGTVINTVNYSVTGAALSSARSGAVNVQNSTQLRFRVGDLPVANGYTMTLGATTSEGTACAGTAGFNIENNQITTLSMTLVCGSGVVVEVDNNGDVAVNVEVVNQSGAICPVVTGISALPLEGLVGSSLSLEGFTSSTEGVTFAWSGSGGSFAASASAVTGFTCGVIPGSYQLTFAIAKTGCDASSMPVTVTCTQRSPYVVPVATGVTTQAILTVGDSPNTKPDGTTPYRMVGIPDGLGAYDNNDGTFSLLANHELGATAGIARAHGGLGAFVSRWTIRKTDLGVLHGEDLIQNVTLWNPTTTAYTPGTNVAFGRFCSADLAPVSALFAGGVGFDGQLFTNGEETGAEGRAWAHGLDGTSWELPRLGKASWENIILSPFGQAKTIAIGVDDTTPGEVYVYVGNKTSSGSPVERAGLTNGTLYGVAVTGAPSEPSPTGIPAGPFTLANLGNVESSTGAALQTASTAANVTRFNRPEDGAWDPANPNDFYFVTTNSPTAPSRLWRLRFQDITQPELGGSIAMLLDGTEGQVMLDNIGVDARGHILLQEDVGNLPRLGQVYRYDIATDTLTTIAQHDPARFTTGAPAFLTQDEESSGVIDASALLGPGWWLLDTQAHYTIAGELVEGGQFIALYDPGTL